MSIRSQTFLSYASEDLETVRKLYAELRRRHVRIWFDKEDLAPGEWLPQVKRAISQSKYFLVCLSKSALSKSANRPGFQDHELDIAFSIAMAQSPDLFTIIPVRIDDCDRGDHRVSIFQQYDLFKDWEQQVEKLAVYLDGVSSFPNDVANNASAKGFMSGLYSRAQALLSASYYDDALRILDAIGLLEGESKQLLEAKRDVYYAAGRYGEASDALFREMGLTGGGSWQDLCMSLSNSGRTHEAIDICDLQLKKDPRNSEAWFHKGVVWAKAENYSEAILAFNNALDIDPNNDEAVRLKGYSHAANKQQDEAIATFTAAILRWPSKWNLYRALGNTLAGVGRFVDAVDVYSRVIDHVPDAGDAWRDRAMARESLGFHDDAKADYIQALCAYERACESDPMDPDAWRGKGEVCRRVGRHEDAVQALTQSLAIDSENFEAWYFKGKSLLDLGRRAEALLAFNKANEINPNNIELRGLLPLITYALDPRAPKAIN